MSDYRSMRQFCVAARKSVARLLFFLSGLQDDKIQDTLISALETNPAQNVSGFAGHRPSRLP